MGQYLIHNCCQRWCPGHKKSSKDLVSHCRDLHCAHSLLLPVAESVLLEQIPQILVQMAVLRDKMSR